MSNRVSLVDFQSAIFKQIDAFRERGDERLCLRASTGKINWAMDAGDILYVTQLPRNITRIPSAPRYIRGLIQQDSDVYTVFDLGEILSGVPTPLNKSNRVLVLHPALLSGVALLVEKTYSLIPMDDMQRDEVTKSVQYGDIVLKEEHDNQSWHWLNFPELLAGTSFAIRRVDIQGS